MDLNVPCAWRSCRVGMRCLGVNVDESCGVWINGEVDALAVAREIRFSNWRLWRELAGSEANLVNAKLRVGEL